MILEDLSSRISANEAMIEFNDCMQNLSKDDVWFDLSGGFIGTVKNATKTPSCWEIETVLEKQYLVRRYVRWGGMISELKHGGAMPAIPEKGSGYLAASIRLDENRRQLEDEIKFFKTFGELEEESKNPMKYLIPLYKFQDGEVVEDLRNMPTIVLIDRYDDNNYEQTNTSGGNA